MICSTYDPDCYGCQLRSKGVAISNAATPNRAANRPAKVRPMVETSWENGVVGERRRDGSFMPVLSPTTGKPMGVKEKADLGSKVDQGIKQVRSAPSPIA